MRVWLIRHGESETNKAGQWTGWLDVQLTEKGREDAAKAGKILAGTSFEKIYASDLSRAKNTAEIAIPGCKYEVSPLLREINVGNIAGKPLSVVRDSNNRPLNLDGYAKFDGESVAQFRERITKFMHILETEDCDNIAIFSHGGFIRRFLDIVVDMELPRKNICCNNCTVAIFDYKDSVWKLHSWINLD